jgi:hypothetical protein
MSTNLIPWDRLVRYVPQGLDDTVRYGEPLLEESQNSLVAQMAKEGTLRVRVLEGDDVLSAKRTDQIDMVAKLLGPLMPCDVPIIRCIGLNYKTHSKSTVHIPNIVKCAHS